MPEPAAAAPPAAPGLVVEPGPAAPAAPLSAEVAQAEVRRRFAGAPEGADDDLKVIRGIGPVIEKMLKEMGIRTFRQVASFTGGDVEVVSAALSACPDRIRRDDWMQGAREAHAAKYGEQI